MEESILLKETRPRVRTKRKWILALVGFLLLIELGLRLFLGFCNSVLYRDDANFEYIALPQDTRRFGNHIHYNSFSQRTGEITSADSVIILGFGDSVINGGALVDDDSLATTKLSNYLTQKVRKKVHVLNISSQSWGPDNCYAYLKKYGNFKAKAMFLVISSHDAYDDMDFQKVVGVSPNYPDTQYSLAIAELLDRYVIPRLMQFRAKKTSDNGNNINKRKKNSVFNTGIYNLYQYAKSHNLPFVIYLHADEDELNKNKYNKYGTLIASFCKGHQIPLIKELDYKLMNADSYRDGIHLTNSGQEQLFQILKNKIYN